MRVYGIDFTSRPTRRKPVTCAECELLSGTIVLNNVIGFTDFNQFEEWLQHPGPWIAGMDFPFGQSRRFIENIGWPPVWADYVSLVNTMSRQQFRQTLDDYRAPRKSGDKEHRRSGDQSTGAISPQKLYGVPVGLMFYEGAKRLLDSGVYIPGLVEGDRTRHVVEAYPGVLARRVTKDGYKSDTRSKQTIGHLHARERIVDYVQSTPCQEVYGFKVEFKKALGDDPSGDTLDSVLCALQAAWAWNQRDAISDRLTNDHRLEGWIADPMAVGLTLPR